MVYRCCIHTCLTWCIHLAHGNGVTMTKRNSYKYKRDDRLNLDVRGEYPQITHIRSGKHSDFADRADSRRGGSLEGTSCAFAFNFQLRTIACEMRGGLRGGGLKGDGARYEVGGRVHWEAWKDASQKRIQWYCRSSTKGSPCPCPPTTS